ncbi:DEAD/DEAH box helicase [Micromonospora okii]|uniref:DEAD/DEAH box helicase n=1 Tax=Micromonospora okii TaxID=1182970 RepID=UPI001E29BE9D|nr:DEAD/DEAH box helicase [Micromonospora okii]
MVDTGSVAQLVWSRWRASPKLAHERFAEPGWSYGEPVSRPCPRCGGQLHSLRKPYVSGGRTYRYVALVCPGCPATFTLAEVGAKKYDEVMRPTSQASTGSTAGPGAPGSTRVPGVGAPRSTRAADPGRPDRPAAPARGGDRRRQTTVTLTGRQVTAWAEAMCGTTCGSGPDVPLGGWPAPTSPPPPPPPALSDRALHWAKVTDPAQWRGAPAGVDVRVLLPDSARTVALRERLRADGVPFRVVRHWVEDETITTNARLELTATARPCALADGSGSATSLTGPGAAAARDAFDLVWQANAPLPPNPPGHVPITQLAPEQWAGLLPHPTFNPAQAEVVPHLLAHDRHVLVVAPTGAGKTVIGMVAALHAVRGQRRKAAWLVPQRSLTDELDRELQRWRRAGLRVERLSGEYAVDLRRARDADVWVATTEKFEALCRAGSVTQALAQVGCLVVDEIHLLGDATRGPVLEALLARVRGASSGVRIVGLSATVANTEDVAGWLGAHLVRVAWRPTRLTWQLPMIAATPDWKAAGASRARLAAALTRQVTGDGGSVLVFCGSKHHVRATALAIAADRGARVHGVDPADLDRVHRACDQVGVGLHYKDWPHKHEAERRFRERTIDVLVATTTVAAGVNLPARAVIVRDTQVGLDDISVATVQQMFGRAGRVGAGEVDGYAYLICDENERPGWQQRLVDGYTVLSQIQGCLPDQLLAEAVQGRIATMREAETWWEQTLAFHQGDRSTDAVAEAIGSLAADGYLTVGKHSSGDTGLSPTELGVLTARLMVPTGAGVDLRTALAALPVPTDPQQAEDHVLDLLAVTVAELSEAPLAEEVRPAVARVLEVGGRLDRLSATRTPDDRGSQTAIAPGDLAKAALRLCVHNPTAMRKPGRAVAGIPTAAMYPIWELAPRYLGWLAGQGYLSAVHPWIAVTAADLSRRIRWRAAAPQRGAGRLLWMCEQMATPLHAATAVPALFAAATERGITDPDWASSARPSGCRLGPVDYAALLGERATAATVDPQPGGVKVTAPPGAVLVVWSGAATSTYRSTGVPADLAYPPGDPAPRSSGIAIFTRRGDVVATDWLGSYRRCVGHEEHIP